MFSSSPKDNFLQKLDDIVHGLEQSLENRKKQTEASLNMSINLIKFVRKEIPPFEKGISFALAPMNKIAKIEEQEYNAEERLKDDLKDLLERRKVIKKLEIEYDSAIQSFEQAKVNFNQAKMDLQYEYDQKTTGKILQDAEERYRICKQDRISSLSAAKEATQTLIEQKKKFERFMVNRVKHGFLLYSTEIERCSKEQFQLYTQMSEAFSELRKKIPDLASGNLGSLNPNPSQIIKEENEVKEPEIESTESKEPQKDAFGSFRNPFDEIDVK